MYAIFVITACGLLTAGIVKQNVYLSIAAFILAIAIKKLYQRNKTEKDS